MRVFTKWAAVAAAVLSFTASAALAQTPPATSSPILSRHLDTTREEANKKPRNEGDQALVAGWPLYRSARGQEAFNHAMATLAATGGTVPPASAFKGCSKLECPLSLPPVSNDGWLPAGRLWISPGEYLLIAHSPRNKSGKYRRHAHKRMKYFVLHEFINSSRNVDPFDTISSHDDDVFVSLYMSKQRTDARGRRFVMVVQVAPIDVISVHATNLDSLGPGIEVAKNAGEELEPLQALGGILVAALVKSAVPHLEVIKHRGNEGLPMLEAYDARIDRLKRSPGAAAVALPFAPAHATRVGAVAARLDDLILRPGASPPIAVADRGFLPVRAGLVPSALPVLREPPRLVRRSDAPPGPVRSN